MTDQPNARRRCAARAARRSATWSPTARCRYILPITSPARLRASKMMAATASRGAGPGSGAAQKKRLCDLGRAAGPCSGRWECPRRASGRDRNGPPCGWLSLTPTTRQVSRSDVEPVARAGPRLVPTSAAAPVVRIPSTPAMARTNIGDKRHRARRPGTGIGGFRLFFGPLSPQTPAESTAS